MAALPHASPPGPPRWTPVRRVARLALAQSHTAYHQTNLVSDVPGLAALTDPNLVNSWGLAAGPTTPLWSNDNGTDVATVYSGGVNGSAPAIVPLVVRIPGGAGTGVVFNDQSAFTVSAGGVTAPARFIFVTEAGTLSGWAPNVPLNGEAQLKATVPGAVYKGLATLTNNQGSFLYAANFSAGRIDVFDSNWSNVPLSGNFIHSQIPTGFAP